MRLWWNFGRHNGFKLRRESISVRIRVSALCVVDTRYCISCKTPFLKTGILPVGARGGIGRRARFRFWWGIVRVQISPGTLVTDFEFKFYFFPLFYNAKLVTRGKYAENIKCRPRSFLPPLFSSWYSGWAATAVVLRLTVNQIPRGKHWWFESTLTHSRSGFQSYFSYNWLLINPVNFKNSDAYSLETMLLSLAILISRAERGE